MSMTEKLIIMGLLSLTVTTVVYPFVLRYALRHRIVDNPDARKIHRKPIPVMGGVVVYAGILAGCLAMWLLIEGASIHWSLMAVTTMLLLGVWDDMKNLPAILRLFVQFAIVGAYILLTDHYIHNFYGLFGIYYALLFVPLILRGRMNKKAKVKWSHGWLLPPAALLRIVGTYLLIVVGQIIFRSVSVPDAFGFMAQIVQGGKTELPPYIMHSLVAGLLCLAVVVVNDWMEECRGDRTGNGLLRSERPVAVVALVVLLVAATLFLSSSASSVAVVDCGHCCIVGGCAPCFPSRAYVQEPLDGQPR